MQKYRDLMEFNENFNSLHKHWKEMTEINWIDNIIGII